MTRIHHEINKWITTLPYWEQAAFEKLVIGNELVEEDYLEFLRYLLEDAGLTPKTINSRPALLIASSNSTSADQSASRILLKQISNLKNVNALATEQTITFAEKLTVIFGANGSGKSGYARVISSGAFTRGDSQVLRDVTQPSVSTEPMMAEIQFAIDNNAQTLQYEIGQPSEHLSRSPRVLG